VREIVKILKGCPGEPVVLEPSRMGVTDRIELWRAQSSPRLAGVKNLFVVVLKSLRTLSGVTMVPSLSLAIRKGAE